MNDCMALTASGDTPVMLALANIPGNHDAVLSLIFLNIAALDEYLHLNNRLTEAEAEDIASKVLHAYGGAFSFADLNLVLERAKNGYYGRFFERLSAPEIMTWFEQYYNERINAAEDNSYNEYPRSVPRRRERGNTWAVAAGELHKSHLVTDKEQIDAKAKETMTKLQEMIDRENATGQQ